MLLYIILLYIYGIVCLGILKGEEGGKFLISKMTLAKFALLYTAKVHIL